MSVTAALTLFSGSLQAAGATPSQEDIHFLGEHLAEAAQDARYFALPWPTTVAPQGKWRPLVSVAGADFSVELAKARGGMLTLIALTSMAEVLKMY